MNSFLQSPEWQKIQESIGRRTWRTCDALVIEHDLPFGFRYLYCPRLSLAGASLDDFFSQVKELARKEKFIFLKIDSAYAPSNIQIRTANYRTVPSSPLQPRRTAILYLQKPEEELLKAIHEKTRYNIRLAERKGVEVTTVIHNNVREDFEIFWRLLQETAARDEFHTHERDYYEKLLAVRTADFSNELFFARLGNQILAAAMINFYRDPKTDVAGATYLHGASSHQRREVMAPHLLHWSIIRNARARGAQSYDFWGIDEKKWPGITRFKLAFGGAIVEYPQSLDVVFRLWWYRVYQTIKN